METKMYIFLIRLKILQNRTYSLVNIYHNSEEKIGKLC